MTQSNQGRGWRKGAFSHLSPVQISNSDPIELGSGGFCFLVAELLKGKFPRAELYRLTNPGRTSFDHVFLRINEKACDIHGYRTVDEMRFALNNNRLEEEITNLQAIQAYFSQLDYTPEQLAGARVVLCNTIRHLNL